MKVRPLVNLQSNSAPCWQKKTNSFTFTLSYSLHHTMIHGLGKYSYSNTCVGNMLIFLQAVCCVRWSPVVLRRWMKLLKAPAEHIWSGESCQAWREPGWCSRLLVLSGQVFALLKTIRETITCATEKLDQAVKHIRNSVNPWSDDGLLFAHCKTLMSPHCFIDMVWLDRWTSLGLLVHRIQSKIEINKHAN